jgi:hypothetical protein
VYSPSPKPEKKGAPFGVGIRLYRDGGEDGVPGVYGGE